MTFVLHTAANDDPHQMEVMNKTQFGIHCIAITLIGLSHGFYLFAHLDAGNMINHCDQAVRDEYGALEHEKPIEVVDTWQNAQKNFKKKQYWKRFKMCIRKADWIDWFSMSFTIFSFIFFQKFLKSNNKIGCYLYELLTLSLTIE